MSLYYEIRMCGEGGQGLMIMGNLVARSLMKKDGIRLLLNKAYGPETRGGACKSELIVSDEDIRYPKVTHPDYVLALSEKAYEKYCRNMCDCTVILDSSIKAECPKSCKIIRYPFIETARRCFGNTQAANMIALGMLAKICPFLDRTQIMTDIDECFKKSDHDKAFDMGYSAVDE